MNPASDSTRAVRAVLLLGILFYAVIVLRTAWVCDDAYITLRTVDNFTHGLGLRWNVAERVQTYTHPLWMFTLSAVYYVTQEAFYTTIAVSLLVSVAAVSVLVVWGARSLYWGLLALAALILSQAFIDYSSSGLENPMTHLLLAVFAVVFLWWKPGFGRLLLLGFIAALGMVNRMDTALLYGPALLIAWWEGPRLTGIFALALGFVPFGAWEIFSLVYYGFLAPNTAFAKLGTGLNDAEVMVQGLHYLQNALFRDTLTVAVMVAGVVAALLRGNRRALALAAGVVLYVFYVIKVGGDFMSGRFFTAPFFVAVALVTCYTEEERAQWHGRVAQWGARLAPVAVAFMLFGSVAWAGLGAPKTEAGQAQGRGWAKTTPTIFSGEDYGDQIQNFKDPNGVGDERRFYYRDAGLLQYARGVELPRSRFVAEGKAFRAVGKPIVRRAGSVGYRGYFAGPEVHLLDYYALGDPLLARLPALYNPNWRIGHFTRFVPEGYEATLRELQEKPVDYLDHTNVFEGMPWEWPFWEVLKNSLRGKNSGNLAAWPLEQNRIADEKLARYYDQLVLVTRGPLFSHARWEAIWKLNTGQYDYLIDRDAYRFAGLEKRVLNALAGEVGVAVNIRGLEVVLPEMSYAPGMTVTLDGDDIYRILLMRGSDLIATQDVGPSSQPRGGKASYDVNIGLAIAGSGYDAVRIFPVSGDKNYRVFGLALENESAGLADGAHGG